MSLFRSTGPSVLSLFLSIALASLGRHDGQMKHIAPPAVSFRSGRRRGKRKPSHFANEGRRRR